MILIGKIKKGFGEGNFWVKKAEKEFLKKTGMKMFYGTLNVELEKDFILDGNLKVLHKEEYGGTQDVYLKECEVLGHKSYILRTNNHKQEKKEHSLNIIEIVSDVNFKEKYCLKNGSIIEILVR